MSYTAKAKAFLVVMEKFYQDSKGTELDKSVVINEENLIELFVLLLQSISAMDATAQLMGTLHKMQKS